VWIKRFKFFFLKNVKKIQLWHGIGFKYIELANENEFKSGRSKILHFLVGRFPCYDVVISTSEFYTRKVFSKAFNYKYIWETGYPRNDVFLRNFYKGELLNVDKSGSFLCENPLMP